MVTLPLFTAWVATTVGLITAGTHLDNWMEAPAREDISKKLRSKLGISPRAVAGWVRAINDAFLDLFDRLYMTTNSRLDKIAWRSILAAYVILVLARAVLWVFAIPTPPTEAICFTALGITTGAGLFVNAFYNAEQLYNKKDVSRKADLLFSKQSIALALSMGTGASLFIVIAAETGHALGVSVRALTAYAVGTTLASACVMLLYLMPDRWFPVKPIRAVVSSFIALFLLGLSVPRASESGLSMAGHGHLMIVTYLAFNLFADAVSLVETRWVLTVSRKGSLLRILTLLIVDLVLSGMIYLALPSIADQNFKLLEEGVLFHGKQPWLGVLFWSTFATSVLFYLFVVAALLVKPLASALSVVQAIDKVFSIFSHPVRLIALSMVLVETVAFGIIAYR